MNCAENSANPLTLDDLITGLGSMADLLSFVSVSAGVYAPEGQPCIIIPSRSGNPRCLWREQSRLLKRALGLPTFLAGNVDSVADIEELIAEGCADVGLMARADRRDPDVVAKSVRGEADTVPGVP